MPTQPDDSEPDLVIDEGQVFGKTRRRRNSRWRRFRKRLKPIYIGPLRPDSSGILNVRGHLGLVVLTMGVLTAVVATFEVIPVVTRKGFLCPSVAALFGLLTFWFGNSEFYAMKKKSLDNRFYNRQIAFAGLLIGSISGLVALFNFMLGIFFYFQN